MSGNNDDTSESIIETRHRAGVNQATLNIELALSNRNSSSGDSGGTGVSGGISGGNVVTRDPRLAPDAPRGRTLLLP